MRVCRLSGRSVQKPPAALPGTVFHLDPAFGEGEPRELAEVAAEGREALHDVVGGGAVVERPLVARDRRHQVGPAHPVHPQQPRLGLQVGQQAGATGRNRLPHRIQGLALQAVEMQRLPQDRVPAAAGVEAEAEACLAVERHRGQVLHLAPGFLHAAERGRAHRPVGVFQPVHQLPHGEAAPLAVVAHLGTQRAGQLVVQPAPGVIAVGGQGLGQGLALRVHLAPRQGALPFQEEGDGGRPGLLADAAPGGVRQPQQALVDLHLDGLEARLHGVQAAAELGGHRVRGIGRGQALHEAVRLPQLRGAVLPGADCLGPSTRLHAERGHLPGQRFHAPLQPAQELRQFPRTRATGEDHLHIPRFQQLHPLTPLQAHAPRRLSGTCVWHPMNHEPPPAVAASGPSRPFDRSTGRAVAIRRLPSVS